MKALPSSKSTFDEVDAAGILRKLLHRLPNDDSLVNTIAAGIGADIVEGRLPPGADLNSVDLARRFETSRTPVREALLLLAKEGLVEVLPRRRPRVAERTLDAIQDICEVRAALFALISEQVVRNASDDDLERLQDAHRRMEMAARRRDIRGFQWAVSAFRDVETELALNREVKRILDSLEMRVLQHRHFSLTAPGRLERSARDYRHLMDAYLERDALLAAAVNRSLILGGFAAIASRWRENYAKGELTSWSNNR